MRIFTIAICLFLTALLGCSSPMNDKTVYDPHSYKGDGVIKDLGKKAASERFQLDLGPLDLSKAGMYQFRMSHLPPVELNLSLKMTDMPPLPVMNDAAKDYNKAQVQISLKTDSGKTIFNHDLPLSRWTWSGRMKGSYRDVYIRDVPPGSSFSPKGDESYELTLKITPDPSSRGTKPTSLQITGGGWKVQ